MKKSLTILLILLVSIFVVACGTKSNNVSKTGFIGGKEGLISTLSISSSSTKANEIFDNNSEPFQVALNLKNKGEATVKAGDVIIELNGIDLSAFQISEKDGVSKNLDQLDKSRVEGGKLLPVSETNIVYNANYKYNEPTDKTQDLGVNFCYKYQTLTTSDACLRKDITKTSTDAKCKVEEQKLAGNSGSPVQVTLINERPSSQNEVTFTVQVENLGKGTVYDQSFLSKNKCHEDKDDKNKLHISINFPENNPVIKCERFGGSNEGTLTMFQNKASVSCSVDTSSLQETTFTKSLRVTSDYVYQDAISTKIVIKSTS